MSDTRSPEDYQGGDIEAALLDAELFVKYKVPERAIKRLRSAIDLSPRSVQLRERLREVAATSKHPEEAARQCLALASLYIEREDFETAHDRLLEAKQLDARINIAPGLDAIRRARRPDLRHRGGAASAAPPNTAAVGRHQHQSALAGDLSVISIFDVIQVVENTRLTGALSITGGSRSGYIFFNEGRIVGAEAGEASGQEAFRKIVEATDGAFELERSAKAFPVTIIAASNTNLILDSLRIQDEENKEENQM